MVPEVACVPKVLLIVLIPYKCHRREERERERVNKLLCIIKYSIGQM